MFANQTSELSDRHRAPRDLRRDRRKCQYDITVLCKLRNLKLGLVWGKEMAIPESDMALLLRSRVRRVRLYLRSSPNCMESWKLLSSLSHRYSSCRAMFFFREQTPKNKGEKMLTCGAVRTFYCQIMMCARGGFLTAKMKVRRGKK